MKNFNPLYVLVLAMYPDAINPGDNEHKQPYLEWQGHGCHGISS